ncbi:MAG: SMI1/KNR4 family protein [Tepidisphaeraceae bacterium]
MTPVGSIADSLKRIKVWLKRKAPDVIESFAPAATDEQIRGLEQKLDISLPVDVSAFYREHDGAGVFGLFPSSEFDDVGFAPMSLAEIEECCDPAVPPPKKKQKLPTDSDLGLWEALRLLDEQMPSATCWPIPPSSSPAWPVRNSTSIWACATVRK